MILSMTTGSLAVNSTEEPSIYTQTLASNETDFVMGEGGIITNYTGTGGNVQIPSTIAGTAVLGIGSNAFQNNTSIESVTMPSSLKRIEQYAFDGCSNLRSVTLNDGLEYLGRDCFARTTKLSAIWIPSTVVELARGVFYRSGLTSAYVPATVRTMGTHVFQECQQLTKAIFMATVETLPESTFSSSVVLEEVYLTEGIANIGTSAFYGCNSLKEITLPSTTKTIKEYAFFGCSKLEKLDFSNTQLTTVELAAFQYCFSLTEAIFPYGFQTFVCGENTMYTDKAQFYGCTSLEKVVLPSTITACYYRYTIPFFSVGLVLNYITNNYELLNHPFIDCNPSLVIYGYPNTCIATLSTHTNVFAFSGLNSASSESATLRPNTAPQLPTQADMVVPQVIPQETPNASDEGDFVLGAGGVITSYLGQGGDVVIPSSISGTAVLGIGANAFQNNANIESVTMPSTMERIENSAFDGCSNLHTVNLNEGLYFLGERCFQKTSNLTSIWFPSTVNTISYAAFYQSGLTSVYVPETVKIVGTSVFRDCKQLSSGIFMADVHQLPESTFRDSVSLQDVYLKEGIVTIGTSSFQGCTGLQQITLPTTTKNIYQYAFYGCSSLRKMDMSNTRLSFVDFYAFQHCVSLTEVIFPYGFRTFAYGETSLDTEKAQFIGCSSLVKVVLPSTIDPCHFFYQFLNYSHLNQPFTNTNSNLVIYGYPNTSIVELASLTSAITFSSLGELSSENRNPDLSPTTVPTLPTAPSPSTTTSAPSSSYATWAVSYVDFVSSEIMPDISPDNYATSSNRGLIAQSLYNMSGDGGTYSSNFSDAGNYGTAIGWCYAHKVMAGSGDTWFNTEGNVTREEFALILRQLATVQGKNNSYDLAVLEQFPDGNSGNAWAQSGLAWALKNGIMSGNSNGTLNPSGPVSPVEVAVMLSNFVNLP